MYIYIKRYLEMKMGRNALNGNGKILAKIARCLQEKEMQHHQKEVWGYKVLIVERGCGRRALRERN